MAFGIGSTLGLLIPGSSFMNLSRESSSETSARASHSGAPISIFLSSLAGAAAIIGGSTFGSKT